MVKAAVASSRDEIWNHGDKITYSQKTISYIIADFIFYFRYVDVNLPYKEREWENNY